MLLLETLQIGMNGVLFATLILVVLILLRPRWNSRPDQIPERYPLQNTVDLILHTDDRLQYSLDNIKRGLEPETFSLCPLVIHHLLVFLY